jgi:hypothetical protein
MKLKLILLTACLAAGVAASIAFAAPQRRGESTTTGTTAATTTGRDHHGDDGDHHGGKPADAPKCSGVELKGTVSGGSLTVAVTRADHRNNALVGSTATVAVSGPVSIHARMCGTTLTLQNLEVGHAKPSTPPPGTTTTTSTTP